MKLSQKAAKAIKTSGKAFRTAGIGMMPVMPTSMHAAAGQAFVDADNERRRRAASLTTAAVEENAA